MFMVAKTTAGKPKKKAGLSFTKVFLVKDAACGGLQTLEALEAAHHLLIPRICSILKHFMKCNKCIVLNILFPPLYEMPL